MKKEYKAPVLHIVEVKVESLMAVPISQQQDNPWANGKKSGRIYEDEEAAPAATPKGFWDDEN